MEIKKKTERRIKRMVQNLRKEQKLYVFTKNYMGRKKKKNEYRSYLDNSIKIIHELNFD